MALTAGIVGLPNVGKSTLFNALTNNKILASNYPFATINPNIGTVSLKDFRLNILQNIYQSNKVIPATFKFIDIAGIVKGANKGEGLGNQFLAHIREVDSICHMVRCFDMDKIIHVEGRINPIEDIEIVNLELILSDLESVNKRYNRIRKSVKSEENILEMKTLEKIRDFLEKGFSIRSLKLNEIENKIVTSLSLLTNKPVLYIANVSDYEYSIESNYYVKAVYNFAKKEGSKVVILNASLEEEISQLEEKDKQEFLDSLNIKYSGINQLAIKSYELLGLETYFTAGKKEIHAWTFKKGITAREASKIIHSDFQRGFICAETFSFEDLNKYKSIKKIKELGLVRIEGKAYIVKDGDVLLFRFNVLK